jgi:hypothetical protein
MCTHCKDITGDLARPHSVSVCPLLKSQYCSVCASFGHCPLDCPDSLKADEAPQFLEQLIPPSLLMKYGITTRTPIAGVPTLPAPVSRPPIEIVNTEDEVRACLISLGGKPCIAQPVEAGKEGREFQENTKRLQKLADSLGRRLVLIPPKPVTTPAVASTAPKKTFRIKTKAQVE